jgi:hypothetical protein
MGYYTSVEGEIAIEPPLVWSEFKDSRFNSQSLDSYDGMSNIKLRIHEETVDTDEGQLVRFTATALVPAWGESSNYYHLVEHVQAAIDSFRGHTFSGRFECSGEEPGDLWRLVIREGRAVKVKPQLVWPDET